MGSLSRGENITYGYFHSSFEKEKLFKKMA
jgi:hypothetical protein